MTARELEFAVFCIENTASSLNKGGEEIYDRFISGGDLLHNYIIPCYDSLHTQGKDYIVNDLIEVMNSDTFQGGVK